jgi:hypothetical protein
MKLKIMKPSVDHFRLLLSLVGPLRCFAGSFVATRRAARQSTPPLGDGRVTRTGAGGAGVRVTTTARSCPCVGTQRHKGRLAGTHSDGGRHAAASWLLQCCRSWAWAGRAPSSKHSADMVIWLAAMSTLVLVRRVRLRRRQAWQEASG